ncbi:hypothetical protein [Aminipila sp.]|nr:hypothetical protein [Aminipila sp.]
MGILGKMLVSKKEWAEKVLPDQIKSHWEDANALYNDILFIVVGNVLN